MIDLKTHEYLCKKEFGDKCTKVHKFLDQKFAKYGARHRHFYHHWEGIRECAKIVHANYGLDYDLAYEAAIHHVKEDFNIQGHQLSIPHKEDYKSGDGSWPVGDDWNQSFKSWNTKATDKDMSISEEKINEVKEKLK